VLKLTGCVGVDLVIDPVGGEGFNRSVAAVRHGSTVAAIGFLGGGDLTTSLLPVIFKEVRVQGANGGSVAVLTAAVAAMAAHRIEPVIDRTFSLRDLKQAYELMAQGSHFGKIAVRFDW